MQNYLFEKLKKKIQTRLYKLHNYFRCGVAKCINPAAHTSGLKVHLGCGPINIQGWINIDGRDATHIHLHSNGFELNEFTDGSISEIYMCHVLEHFSFSQTNELLKTMHRKLKFGGVLRLSVPDFDLLVEIYTANGKNLELIKMALMGGQDYDYNFHKGVFNKTILSKLLSSTGFSEIKSWDTIEDFGVDLSDWSNKLFITPNGNFPVSLNIKAVKS
jgi:predicted SAM-dependent methyltransferase